MPDENNFVLQLECEPSGSPLKYESHKGSATRLCMLWVGQTFLSVLDRLVMPWADPPQAEKPVLPVSLFVLAGSPDLASSLCGQVRGPVHHI
jgi:hypothetical protein